MNFEQGYLYHVFNQGNNKRKIFFSIANYQFFKAKIKTYILPYADVLAWCLMPNHFHLMLHINHVNLDVDSHTVTSNHGVTKVQTRSLNDSIGIMLRSYTRAINKQEDFKGKLFREGTKAECLNCQNGISPAFIEKEGITIVPTINPSEQYPIRCFEYIHNNPVKAGIVMNPIAWKYSSARAYTSKTNDGLINPERALKYIIMTP